MSLTDKELEEVISLDRMLCQNDLSYFSESAWHVVEPGRKFVKGWHIDAISDHLTAVLNGEIRNLIINIPPRHMKSLLISVLFPAWAWTKKPELRWLFSSYSSSLSVRDSVKCRRIIQSEWYQERFGNIYQLTGDQNAKAKYENTRMGHRIATSVDGSGTGEGGDCFPSGVEISTLSGYKDISKIEVGDVVKSFNHTTGKIDITRVEAVRSRRVRSLVEISTVSGRKVLCTPEHHFFTKESGYWPAVDLSWKPSVSRRIKETSQGISRPKMLLLQERIRTTAVRFREVLARWWDYGLLLFKDLFAETSRIQEQCKMSDMRRLGYLKGAKKRRQVVLNGLCSDSVEVPRKKLRGMQYDVQAAKLKEAILSSELRRQGAFATDDGYSKFMVYPRDFTDSYCEEDASVNHGSRPASMQSLLHEVEPSNASHQRRSKKQPSGELNYTLLALPHNASQVYSDSVSMVSELRTGEFEVYDIQVERNHNFFANGLLVHNCIIVDDPHKVSEAESDTVRQKALEWWDGEMSTRGNDPKSVAKIVVMQRVHQNDLSGHLLAKESGWEHLCLPAEYEPERKIVTSIGWEDPRKEAGELLWPQRFGKAEIDELKKELGSKRASGQLQQRPAPAEGNILKREWWRYYKEIPHDINKFGLSADLTFKKGPSNDFTVLQVWGRRGADKYLLDQIRARMGFNDQIKSIKNLCAKWQKADAKWIEDAANASALIDTLRSEIPGLIPCPPRTSKIARAEAVSPQIESGNVYLPDPSIAPWVNDFVEECATFPSVSHDDQVDAMSLGLIKISEGVKDDWMPISLTGTSKWLR